MRGDQLKILDLELFKIYLEGKLQGFVHLGRTTHSGQTTSSMIKIIRSKFRYYWYTTEFNGTFAIYRNCAQFANMQNRKTLKCGFKVLVHIYKCRPTNLCYELAESVGSLEQWLWDISGKNNKFLLFLLFGESFKTHNFGTTGPIQIRFSAKCTSPNEHFK